MSSRAIVSLPGRARMRTVGPSSRRRRHAVRPPCLRTSRRRFRRASRASASPTPASRWPLRLQLSMATRARGLDVIGITGTNGKTTTAHLVRAAIDGATGRPSCGLIGTVGHSFGTFTRAATHTTPEADELNRVLLSMRAARCNTCGHGRCFVNALASHRVEAHPLSRGGVHEPDAQSPRLPRHDGALYAAAKDALFT